MESVLAEHPHLFWIAPNPLDADGDAKLWEFRLRSTGFFLRLLRDQKLKLLEFSLFAFFFNEVRCNPYMTDMLFVSSCFDKTSRQSHLRHMAEAIHFLHLLCLPAWMSSTDSFPSLPSCTGSFVLSYLGFPPDGCNYLSRYGSFACQTLSVKCDHRSKFSNLNKWKEEA